VRASRVATPLQPAIGDDHGQCDRSPEEPWIPKAEAARAKVRDQKPRSTASWSSKSLMSPAALAVRRDLPRFDELIAITGGIVGRIPGGTTNNIGLIGTLSGRHESRTIGRTLSLRGSALGSSDMLPHRRWWSAG
jgi:hypothetical protein